MHVMHRISYLVDLEPIAGSKFFIVVYAMLPSSVVEVSLMHIGLDYMVRVGEEKLYRFGIQLLVFVRLASESSIWR
jgi:hypothetical protein